MEGKFLMEDKIYLAEKFAHCKLGAMWWRGSVVDLVKNEKPFLLADITKHVVVQDVALEVVSALLRAGLTGDEIVDVFWSVALFVAKEFEVEA